MQVQVGDCKLEERAREPEEGGLRVIAELDGFVLLYTIGVRFRSPAFHSLILTSPSSSVSCW